jgi:rsbT co-antagonist protein RsbR
MELPVSAPPPHASILPRLVETHEADILRQWVEQQRVAGRAGSMGDAELRRQCAQFLDAVRHALAADPTLDPQLPAWAPVREQLDQVSRARALQGFTPRETAMFVFSLKQPLFAALREAVGDDARALAEEMWAATQLVDQLGLYTTEAHQRGREEVIRRQQQDMLELSTPVVRLWEGTLALPMIGTLDSARTQVMMETLLQQIVETEADVAILDITGVPTVDTLTAQHILKTVTAARLMGAECIISGIRPQIAQTIVHLGVDLGDVTTKATLADAFRLALQRRGAAITRVAR